jgi:hypothetical protein
LDKTQLIFPVKNFSNMRIEVSESLSIFPILPAPLVIQRIQGAANTEEYGEPQRSEVKYKFNLFQPHKPVNG